MQRQRQRNKNCNKKQTNKQNLEKKRKQTKMKNIENALYAFIQNYYKNLNHFSINDIHFSTGS